MLQVAVTSLVVVAATAAGFAHIIGSDALVGIYSATLGYVFGFNNGHKAATR
jgi:hypothetical protein